MALHLSNGRTLTLRQSYPVFYGRADQQRLDKYTSRQHCSLEVLCQGSQQEVVKLTSLSRAAPTRVYRAGGSDPEILCTGQHALLQHNDRFSTGAGLETVRVDLQHGGALQCSAKARSLLAGPPDSHLCAGAPARQAQPREPVAAQQQQQLQQAAPYAGCTNLQQQQLQQQAAQPAGRANQLQLQQREQSPSQQPRSSPRLRQQHASQMDASLPPTKRRRASGSLGQAEGAHVVSAGAGSTGAAAGGRGGGGRAGAEDGGVARGGALNARGKHGALSVDASAAAAAAQAAPAAARGGSDAGVQSAAPAAPVAAGGDAAAPVPAAAASGVAALGPRKWAAKASRTVAAAKPVMLILVGINGSGKSTFSEALARSAQLPFVRVNQDSIRSDGTPGTRKQCVAATSKALMAGKSVVLDRCNLNEDQRKDFMGVANALGAPVHAVVLDLPFEVCLERAVSRTSHPSGKLGKKIVPIVHMMRQEMLNGSPPSASEGVCSVIFCRTEADVARTLQAWQSYDGAGDPPSGSIVLPHRPDDAGVEQAVGKSRNMGSNSVDVPPVRSNAQAGGGRTVGSGSGSRPGNDSSKKGSKRAPPAASAASVNLMRSLFTRPQGNAQAPMNHDTLAMRAAAVAASGAPPIPASGAPPIPQAPEASLPRSCSDTAVPALQAASATVAPAPAATAPAATAPAATAANPAKAVALPSSPGYNPTPRAWNRFQQALYYMARDPSTIDSSKQGEAHVDHLCIRIRDIYPKGQYHALVVAREAGLDSIEDLQHKHLPLLAHMRSVALQYVWQCQQLHPQQRLVFRLGFHTIPSCRQLHLHVVSQDLCGANMKKKDHFQRFTTPFFITLDQVERQLQEHGCVDCNHTRAMGYLDAPLKCHRCNAAMVNFPKLRAHLSSCSALYAGAGAVQAPESEPTVL